MHGRFHGVVPAATESSPFNRHCEIMPTAYTSTIHLQHGKLNMLASVHKEPTPVTMTHPSIEVALYEVDAARWVLLGIPT